MSWMFLWFRQRRCTHHDLATGKSFVARDHHSSPAKPWTCRECGQRWT